MVGQGETRKNSSQHRKETRENHKSPKIKENVRTLEKRPREASKSASFLALISSADPSPSCPFWAISFSSSMSFWTVSNSVLSSWSLNSSSDFCVSEQVEADQTEISMSSRFSLSATACCSASCTICSICESERPDDEAMVMGSFCSTRAYCVIQRA